MASSNPSRAATVAVFSATVVAVATVASYVAYFNGDTYTNGTAAATTMSGTTVKANGGAFTLGTSGLRGSNQLEVDSVSGTTIRARTFTGGILSINKTTTGSGKLSIRGSAGSFICLFDSDAAGYSKIVALDGVLTVSIAGSGDCP